MGDEELIKPPVIDNTPGVIDWQYLKDEEYVDYWKLRAFGQIVGIDAYKNQSEYDKAKGVAAKAKGDVWLKSKLEASISATCKNVDERAAEYEKSGNGLELFEKVFSMPNGGVLVKVGK